MIKHLLQQVLKKCTSIEFFYFSFLKALEWVHVYMIFISKRKRNVWCFQISASNKPGMWHPCLNSPEKTGRDPVNLRQHT